MLSDLFWLTDKQMERPRPVFPKSHDKPWMQDRRVLSGIIFRSGMVWGGAMRLGSTVHRRRVSQPLDAMDGMGAFARMMQGLAPDGRNGNVVTIEATCLKVHRTAPSLRARRGT